MKNAVFVKNIQIGGGAPISIQSMTNTKTTDVAATVKQVNTLADAGCDLVRISTPDIQSVAAMKEIIKEVNVPIIADIHYDYKTAIAALEAGAHKIRINPGNMPKDGIKELAQLAHARHIPIRVGVNEGSLKNETNITPNRLAELAMDNAKAFEDAGHTDLVLAVKSSNVVQTIKSYRILAEMCNYPLHIGVTEAGTEYNSIIKSSIAIGNLLMDGIGDTMRVSITGDPVKEVFAAKKILNAIGMRGDTPEVVSCPTCSRTCIDVENLAEKVEKLLSNVKKPIKVAVMGCAVNGIGESKGADFGVCGGKEQSVLIYKGEVLKTIKNSQIIDELSKLIEEW